MNKLVIITNPCELTYIQTWFQLKGIDCGWMGKREIYPIAFRLKDGLWTDKIDKNHVTFYDFIKDETIKAKQ